MGKEQDHHVGDRKMLVIVSFVALAAGVASIIIGFYGWNSQNLINVDRIVKFNLLGAGDDSFVLTVRKCMFVLIILGFVAILSSMGGAYGAHNQHKGLTCQYLVMTAFLGVSMLFLGVHALNRQTQVQSIVDGQIQDICRKGDYMRYTQNLGCPGALLEGQQPLACGEVCQVKLQNLKALNACSYLPRICRQFVYVSDDATPFTLPSTAAFYTTSDQSVTASDADCQSVCNEDVTCVAYALSSSACSVASDNWDSRYTAGSITYTKEPSTFSPQGLQLKGNPLVLDSFQKHGERMACAILLLAFIMLIAAFLTWKVQYNQVLDKEGKPGAGQICRMLCCCPVDKREYREPVEEDGLLSS